PWSDTYDVVLEDTFSNNINPDDPNELDNNNYKARPITVLLTSAPDLVVSSVTASAEAAAGTSFTVRWTVKNQGPAETAEESWGDFVYLSDSPDLNAPGTRTWQLSPSFTGVPHTGRLQPGQSYAVEQTFLLSPEVT